MSASIYDVAKRAGVSISTVSRILNNTAVVNEKKAAAVREAMEYYRYEPNQFARGLVKQKSGMIGVCFAAAEGIAFGPSYYLELLKGIEKVLSQNNYGLVLINEKSENERNPESKARFQELITRKKIDGLLIGGSVWESAAMILGELLHNQYPVVHMGEGCREIGYSVHTGYMDYMLRMCRILYEYGHREIVVYYPPVREKEIEQVEEEAHKKLLNLRIHTMSYPEHGNTLRLRQILTVKKYVLEQGCTAICSPDIEFVHTLLGVCREMNLSVPEDISILTVEHRRGEGELLYPPISAMNVPAEYMGAEAARLLLNIIGEEKGVDPVKEYEPEFIERGSINRL